MYTQWVNIRRYSQFLCKSWILFAYLIKIRWKHSQRLMSRWKYQFSYDHWVVSAAEEQSRRKANLVAQGDGKFGPRGWPQDPSKPKTKVKTNLEAFRSFVFVKSRPPLNCHQSVSLFPCLSDGSTFRKISIFSRGNKYLTFCKHCRKSKGEQGED